MESEGVSLPSIHEHVMMPLNNNPSEGRCCGRKEDINDGYYCNICDFFVHKKCVEDCSDSIEHPFHSNHTLQLIRSKPRHRCNVCGWSIKDLCYRCDSCDFDIDLYCAKYPPPEGVSLPVIHKHVMMPWNNNRRIADCCGRSILINDGYYCNICNFFVHKSCVEDCSDSIEHPSHSTHTLQLQRSKPRHSCDLCGRKIKDLCYRCEICDFDMDLYCAKYPPPEVIDISVKHHHKLTLLKKAIRFVCDAKCGYLCFGFPYKCHECDLAFHINCVWNKFTSIHQPAELNHSCHSLHPLKLLGGKPPDNSDEKCRLCERMIGNLFYHCNPCNFTLDIRCALNPPQISRLDLKTHVHQLTLLPRLDSFTCNACGLKGDRSPYICVHCNFIIHQSCLGLPRLININRHDHRVSRTSFLGVLNSVCVVCHKKVDRIWGGYSCQKCPGYIAHSKCATRKDVWNGKELEGVPEVTEDINPYVVIDDYTIQHFSHKKHYLRLHVNGVVYEENKRCNACSNPILFQSSYGCVDCDFILHENCAKCLRKRWHPLHNERLTLITSGTDGFMCCACYRPSNGFSYQHGVNKFDVLCISISDQFDHPSHPDHHLYYSLSEKNKVACNGCNFQAKFMLSCIEDDCRFDICYKCATLPQVVKHRVDYHPLLLCYGEKASGKLWCDICEKETDPKKWFYTCKDHQLSLHTECVIGDFSGLMPKSTIKQSGRIFEVVLNNSMTRPFCSWCKFHSIFPIILKTFGASNEYFCSVRCFLKFRDTFWDVWTS